jgi:hypothetical protein
MYKYCQIYCCRIDISQRAVAAVANQSTNAADTWTLCCVILGNILALLNWLLYVWGAGGVGYHIAVSCAALSAELWPETLRGLWDRKPSCVLVLG